jgi:hypothetical protein
MQSGIVAVIDRYKHTGVGTSQARGLNARIPKALPGYFQQPTLLRIHLVRFSRGNPKVLGIEFVDAIPVAADSLSRWQISFILPPRVRDFDNSVATLYQRLPQRFWRIGLCWKAASHADHRNWIRIKELHVLTLGTQLLYSQGKSGWRYSRSGRIWHYEPALFPPIST